jgi:hypothetical protein
VCPIDEAFFDFWSSQGIQLDDDPSVSVDESEALFGLPISEARMERAADGQIVPTQWFERVRLEYRLERPDGE